MRTRIKICGITRPEDGVAALRAGADFLGFILTESPRRLTLDQARTLRGKLPPEAQVVGVFAEEPPEIVSLFAHELALHAVQVAGWSDAAPDAAGGTAEIWHVLRAAELPDPVTLPMVPLRTYVLDAHDQEMPGGTGKRADWEWARRCVEVGRRQRNHAETRHAVPRSVPMKIRSAGYGQSEARGKLPVMRLRRGIVVGVTRLDRIET